MELKIGVQELARALARAQGIVEKKSTMPMLSHVLLEASKGDDLHVSATDLDVSVTSGHKCEVLKEGKVAVPAKHLFEIVKTLPEKDVVLKRAQNNWLELRSGPAEFRIVGLAAEDFPALPRFEKVQFVDLEARSLLEMIELTSFAASSDETRYNLNGVFFEPVPGGLRTVATDGHRLSLAERQLGGDYHLKKGVILPRKGLAEMKKLLLEATKGDDLNVSATDLDVSVT
ncbi:MAG: DNA polymerase III subunit beta, partial [Myxococcales bacterium]